MHAHLENTVPIKPEVIGTFLPPIERPRGLMMKLVYAMSRRQFGKVLTPLKVISARMPLAFGRFYGKISALDKKLLLPPEPCPRISGTSNQSPAIRGDLISSSAGNFSGEQCPILAPPFDNSIEQA